MADLIDRQAAIDAVNSIVRTDNWKAAVNMVLYDVSSADAVEVVRCKDCIYHIDNTDICQAMPGQWHPEDYCHMGERKDG